MGRAKVSPKGQIVIPAPIRKKYGIKPGSIMEITEGDDRIILKLTPKDPIETAMGMLKGDISLTKELLQTRHEEQKAEEEKATRLFDRKSKGE
ncbi:MAG: AbrB/MazE/SpoVT family DNA-binding domain-containing protein [Candidatus Atribacteria bacterium]|nr:AbrB/MazE/SpoVT family DNA-binding domain-containing protein [Candidatus Atribacteria bacterium]